MHFRGGEDMKKQKIDIEDLTNYQLGIIWGFGSYTVTDMTFRHKDRYFIEQIQRLTDSQIQYQVDAGKPQYKLKTALFDIAQLEQLGWSHRNAEQRDIPTLDDYRDFLRAYIELHSSLDYCTSYTKSRQKYYRLRLRIYGNKILIQSINNVLREHGCQLKAIQRTVNDTTVYIAYTALDEIKAIYNYISGSPCHSDYWQDVDTKLRAPRQYTKGT
jgi:hypothetical protein